MTPNGWIPLTRLASEVGKNMLIVGGVATGKDIVMRYMASAAAIPLGEIPEIRSGRDALMFLDAMHEGAGCISTLYATHGVDDAFARLIMMIRRSNETDRPEFLMADVELEALFRGKLDILVICDRDELGSPVLQAVWQRINTSDWIPTTP